MSRQDEVETSVERVDPLVGTIFDKRFRVEERIAAGGFGAIYRATHVKSGHPIALKVLLPSLAQDLGVVARFRREGATLTALRNPHTITAYELGQAADRTLFITMELLHGESLFERYKANGPFEWKRMVKIAREVCESLEEAHAMGIVHRDLKPTNIHLEQHGDDPDYVKVLDFGIAKILRGSDFDASDITNAGQMIGTIDYMSPEQMVGGTVTGQSDIYTLGIVMYEMIAGTTPFPESLTAGQALAAMMKTKPEPLYLRAPVPEELDRIVMRCLERDTRERYQTVGELRKDLARLLAGIGGNRAAAIDTKPVEKHDEATTFTPPPEQLVRRSKRPSIEDTTFTPPPEPLVRRSKRPSVEETTFTPPPEPLLAQTRGPEWATSEATALIPPSQQLLAESRRAKRPSGEETQFTPPPMQLLDELRAESPPAEWSDDDESIATAKRRGPPASEDNDRVTAVARLADIVERAAMTRGPGGERAAMTRGPGGERAVMTRGPGGERAVTTRGPGGDRPAAPGGAAERALTIPRGAASERAVTVPRGDAIERAVTVPRGEAGDAAAPQFVRPDPGAAVTKKPPSAPPPIPSSASSRPGSAPMQPASSAPVPPRTITPAQPSPVVSRAPTPSSLPPAVSRAPTPSSLPPAVSRAPTPSSLPPAVSRAPTPSSVPRAPAMPRTLTPSSVSPTPDAPVWQTPVPQLAAAPFSSRPATPGVSTPHGPGVPAPAGIAPYTPGMPPHVPTPDGLSPYPLAQQHAAKSFDMGRIAAREAMVRRLIWIVALILASGVGVILATQL